MTHPFLSDLALRVSLHPACRVELRHHWPAPHYHKTQQDIAEEEEAVLRRQTARVAARSSSALPRPSTTGTASAAAAATTTPSAAVNSTEQPFNPFDHFCVRKKREAAHHHRRRYHHHHGPCAEYASANTKDTLLTSSEATAASAALTTTKEKKQRVIYASSPSSKSTTSTAHPTTPSQKAVTTTSAAGAAGKAEHSTGSSTGHGGRQPTTHTDTHHSNEVATTTTVSSPVLAAAASGTPLTQQCAERVSEGGLWPTSSSTLTTGAAAATRGGKGPDEDPPHASITAAAAPPPERKGVVRRKAPASHRRSGRNTSRGDSCSSGSSICSRSSGSGSSRHGDRGNSDLDSEELVPCRDPLHIRLPRNPAHHATGGVPRPLHVTVRWSGVVQRRRRYQRQLRHRQGELDVTPQRQATTTPSCFELESQPHGSNSNNNAETSPNPSDPQASAAAAVTAAITFTLPGSAYQRHSVHKEGREEEDDDDDDSHNMRSCSSDMKGHGEEASQSRPPAASITVGGGGVSASVSVATSHSLRPPSTIDEVSVLGCSEPTTEERHRQQLPSSAVDRASMRSGAHPHASTHAEQQQRQQHFTENGEVRCSSYNVSPAAPTASTAAQQQQQQQYARQPACKSATVFSQSTTTAPRTSLLGITNSELPTPSSSADPSAATTQSYLRRPNSLLIVRSPPQDTSSDDAIAAANGLYYYSGPGIYGRGNGGVGAHGLQQSSNSNLRVTYVTNNTNSNSNPNNAANSSAEGGAGAQQQQRQQPPQLRGLARVPRPYALTISGQGLQELGGSYGQVRSNSGSPTTVVVPGSGTNGAAAFNLSFATPPNSLPSTPHQSSSLQSTPAFANAGGNGNTTAGVRNAPPNATTPAVVQTPPPLSMKTVLVQRRRSSLLRQQQQQQQQLPSFTFFPSPEAVAANLLYRKSLSSPAGVTTHATPPKSRRVQSTASSIADTVAFSPRNVNVAAKNSFSSASPPPSRGPMPVDTVEQSPSPCTAARHRRSSSPSEALNGSVGDRPRLMEPLSSKPNKSSSSTTLHEDPMLLSYLGGGGDDYSPQLGYPPMHSHRNPSSISAAGVGGSLRPLRRSQGCPLPTDVRCTAPYGATSGSFGVGGGHYSCGNVPYGISAGDDTFAGGNGGSHYLNQTSSSLAAMQQQQQCDPAFQSLSFPTAMWMGTGDTDFRDSSLLHPLQQQHPDSPLGPWAYTRPCFYAPSESSAWVEHGRLGATTPTAALLSTIPHPSNYMGFPNAMYSEPATPMFLPQLQPQPYHRLSSLSQQQQQQQGTTVSATSTPHLTQILPPPLPSGLGTPATYAPARRSRSHLLRGGLSCYPTLPGTPSHVPGIFCKLQRSDAQRLRRRGPVPPPGTECPGLAGRLAYDAYRDAVRRGLVKEEEECSYYQSHHCYSPALTLAGARHGGAGDSKANGTPSPSTPTSEPSLRQRHSLSAPIPTRPLCVVSLADCRTTSPTTAKKAKSHLACGTVEGDDGAAVQLHRNSNSNSSNSGGSGAPQSSELSESWGGPCILYQIPRCCDDPYHRDEEALEMISVTTASSCAFGAGLDGLSWREWMPSSPVEAGEEVLRSVAASSTAPSLATAHARTSGRVFATVASGSTHNAPLTGMTAGVTLSGGDGGESFRGPLSKVHGGLGSSRSFTEPLGSAAAAGTSSATNTGVITNANANTNTTTATVTLVPPTPLDIAAPRNADDIRFTDADGREDSPSQRYLQHHHRTRTGASCSSATAAAAAAAADRAASTSSSKRPFIAEWLVSKLQKHMEKKKLKKLKKQQELEAATVAALLGGGGSPPPMHAEEFASPFLSDPALDRSKAEVPHAHSTASTFSEYSDASSPRSSPHRHHHPRSPRIQSTPELTEHERQQLHNRLAYLAAAYQTELVIYEQKCRETLANRRGISVLVERSRTHMTPEAAAAGYFYEAQGGGCGVGGREGDHYHHLLHPLHPHPHGTTSSSPKLAIKTPAAAHKGDDDGDGSHSTSSSSYSSGFSQTVVSVASPVPTDGASANTSSQSPPPAAQTTADRRQHAPDALSNDAGEEEQQQRQQQQQHRPKQELTCAQQQMQAKTLHACAMAEKVEAERVRVALDTVRTKQKSIESWIRALRRQW